MTSDEPERRRHRRFVIAKPVAVHFAGDPRIEAGQLIDFSEHGASLTIFSPVAEASGAYFSFQLDPDTHCEATGSTVRVLPFGKFYGVGIDLVFANPAYLNFLRNLDAIAEATRAKFFAEMSDLTFRFG
jgi:hypothetical protein